MKSLVFEVVYEGAEEPNTNKKLTFYNDGTYLTTKGKTSLWKLDINGKLMFNHSHREDDWHHVWEKYIINAYYKAVDKVFEDNFLNQGEDENEELSKV